MSKSSTVFYDSELCLDNISSLDTAVELLPRATALSVRGELTSL